MSPGLPQYLPITLPFFGLLAGVFILAVVMLEVNALRYTYIRIGLGSRGAMWVLMASLIGSYFNIPIARFPAHTVMSGQEINYFGMTYVIPVVTDWPGTVIAINVGGALIPIAMSLYLFARFRLWGPGILAVLVVGIVCHALARPVHGVGIGLPVFVPSVTAALVGLVLSRTHAATLAYIGGSLGALIGADLLNLAAVRGLGAPVASIGGAGTFDGVFLTGVVAAFIAGFPWGRQAA